MLKEYGLSQVVTRTRTSKLYFDAVGLNLLHDYEDKVNVMNRKRDCMSFLHSNCSCQYKQYETSAVGPFVFFQSKVADIVS